MKATIDVPEELYRQVKAKSALEGRKVREVTVGLFREWVSGRTSTADSRMPAEPLGDPPSWVGALRRYAANAGGRHDMETIRESIARGRVREGARRGRRR